MDGSAARSDDVPTGQWWIPIGVLVALVPTLVVGAVLLPPDAYTSLAIAPFALLGGLLTLLSPVFLHFDRRYLEKTVDWKPSGSYYWMILPPLTLVLPALYLYRRHVHVGVP